MQFLPSANEGQGGNIGIAAPEAVVLQSSTISASANEGQGGRIDIETGVFLQDASSNITATAGPAGIDGEVDIRAVTTDVSGTVTPLPQRFASTSPLSHLRCAQRLRGGQVSSFVVAGRAGLPVDPSGGLPSFFVKLAPDTRFVSAGQSFDQPTATSTTASWYPSQKSGLVWRSANRHCCHGAAMGRYASEGQDRHLGLRCRNRLV